MGNHSREWWKIKEDWLGDWRKDNKTKKEQAFTIKLNRLQSQTQNLYWCGCGMSQSGEWFSAEPFLNNGYLMTEEVTPL